jgi:hypothetical protein
MEDLTTDPEIPGREIAVAAEALYLANLMLIPGLGFRPAGAVVAAAPQGACARPRAPAPDAGGERVGGRCWFWRTA